MMEKKIRRQGLLLLSLLCSGFCISAPLARPKLVVGIVVDQMRWDYLYRYYDRYGSGGFKRLLNGGFSCQNAMINYLPSYTAPGHTCIYTGSVPAIHGIVSNDWIDNLAGKKQYCTGDESVTMNPAEKGAIPMSPKNLLVTTITDELKLATNMRAKVYGVAIKDRGSILPAGHMADAAYWYNDKTGNFTSSSYYKDASPAWLDAFNKRNTADSLVKKGWKLLYAAGTYMQSTDDNNIFERPYKGEQAPVFPHSFDGLTAEERLSVVKSLPAGNTMTLQMAEACIAGAGLGADGVTDFLTVSLSSTDYVGHQFGPNSVEVEDMFLRLDMDLASFLDYLDARVGKGNYLLFLTADHGAAHNTAFLNQHGVPAGSVSEQVPGELSAQLEQRFHTPGLIKAIMNYQVYLDEATIEQGHVNRDSVKWVISNWFAKRPEVQFVTDLEHMGNASLPEPLRTMIVNGYYAHRSGVIQLTYNAGYVDELKPQGTSHGTWNPYDTHIPLLWYGWHVLKGELFTTVDMTDISATLAALLHIQMPNGCTGKVIGKIVAQ